MPKQVYDSQGDRQQASLDDYSRPEDLPYLKTAHVEMRLLVALLVAYVAQRLSPEQDAAAYRRKFQLAELLRDLMDGVLEELKQMDPSNASLRMTALVLQQEAFPIVDGCVQQLMASAALQRLHCWQRFQTWWASVVTGVTELPENVLVKPAGT